MVVHCDSVTTRVLFVWAQSVIANIAGREAGALLVMLETGYLMALACGIYNKEKY